MADDNSSSAPKAAGNTATSGDHDRVQMLSLRADGTPDQTRPEFIDPDATAEATRAQFRQQAVSAADVDARGAVVAGEYADAPQDPSVEELAKKHDAAAKAAEKAADQALKNLG